MKVYIISNRHYTFKKLKELQKGISNNKPFIVVAENGKKIFVTHGSRNGELMNKDFFDKIGYDEIVACFHGTSEVNYFTFREYTVNDETKFFLLVAPTSELNLFNDYDAVMALISNEINKDVIEETEKEMKSEVEPGDNITMPDPEIEQFVNKYSPNEMITLEDALKSGLVENGLNCQYNTGDTFIIAKFKQYSETDWNLVIGFNVVIFAVHARIANYVFNPYGGYIKIKEYGDNVVELK